MKDHDCFYIGNKFGKPDERTNGIYFKIVACMFTAHIIFNGVFISLVDSDMEYFRQFFILFQGIVFMIGAIYAFRLYRKEFS
ncbi:6-aminohexanoate hydrolase [Bacillus sp. B1-b2]|nr:6-aminohexanoate hydrolase [Bacillus sp. B1-b2]